jgi:photosystem II stability/assembly factor-like uncharacterized protein
MSIQLNAQWVSVFELTYSNINGIKFGNQNTGYVVGQKASPQNPYQYLLYKTTNNGESWTNLYLDTSQLMLIIYDISLVNENTGYICGYSSYIFKTTNGGDNWITLYPYSWGSTMIFNAIQFVNEETGYAVGRYGIGVKTTDGGNTWNRMDTTYKLELPFNSLFGLWFINADTGFMGDWNGYIFKTTNGGINWNYKRVSNSNTFDKIRFINDNTGYAAGKNVPSNSGAIYKTTNAGNNWEKILSYNDQIYSMTTVGDSTIYVGGSFSYILKSTDAGKTWINQSIPVIADINDFYFINQSTGFCGTNGYILKTTNGGSTYIGQIGNSIPEDYKLYQNYPNPFNSSTNIKFSVKQKGFLRITLYDITGKEIKSLANQQVQAGDYIIFFNSESLPSGIYYCRMNINNQIKSIKLILIK